MFKPLGPVSDWPSEPAPKHNLAVPKYCFMQKQSELGMNWLNCLLLPT
jgi:hypothetical protein